MSSALEPITRGFATLDQAREILSTFLHRGESPEPPVTQNEAVLVCEAFGAWLWQTTSHRRNDVTVLEGWYNLLRQVTAYVSMFQPEVAARMGDLHRTLLGHVHFLQIHDDVEWKNRPFVGQLLGLINQAERPVPLAELQEQTKVTPVFLHSMLAQAVSLNIVEQIAWEPEPVYAKLGTRAKALIG
ncbi:MAG: hypothetical protein GC129_01720 [Proteobacteria bacterium]|nr:hypothetical protein [Pseudomonadota bacterium]